MGRQLTPEELAIIKETERQGEELANAEGGERKSPKLKPLINAGIFMLIFIAIVFIGYMIVKMTV